ncbi:MAG: trypsin-like serine protease [Gemmatimonadetes bacterium]|nr:trypsin-like serine protease [Gemmatimonadota bacterium]
MNRSRQAATAALVLFAAACGGDPPSQPTGTPNQRPTAAFTVDVTEGSAPLEVRFDASASTDPDGNIVSYAWDFGDGNAGSGRIVTHTYEDPGAYTPSLTVTDDRGATHTATGDPIAVFHPPGTGENEISGVVWHDANADGVQDEEEETIPAFVVFLDEDGDGIRDTAEVFTVTNDDGEYIFEGLDHRLSYTVTQELTLGWTNTAPGVSASTSGPTVQAIIGGEEAEPGEFPFQVALVSKSSKAQFCGGVFISGTWVMTAAHCVDGNVDPDRIQVLAGTHDLSEGGEYIDVQRIRIHPDFSADAFISSDMALLELDGEFMYPRLELLTPDRIEMSAPGTIATVIGWGLTSVGGGGSEILRKLRAEIISNDECKTHLNENILDTTICAGKQGSSESTCNGDSGGPLMVPFRSRWLQVGIVSFGTNICYQPTAFARVSALVNYPLESIPPELSGSVLVDWSDGEKMAVADFGNFR